MKVIPLSSGLMALVDDEDFNWLSQTKWSDDGRGYAIRKVSGKNTTEKMHRLIMNAKPGEQVDHINGVPYDNRRSNLRIASNSDNAKNKRKPYSTNKSGYKGVAVHGNGKWTAQITVNYRKIHLGVFTCRHEAARAYNAAALKYYGEFANLNKVVDEDKVG